MQYCCTQAHVLLKTLVHEGGLNCNKYAALNFAAFAAAEAGRFKDASTKVRPEGVHVRDRSFLHANTKFRRKRALADISIGLRKTKCPCHANRRGALLMQ